MTKTVVVPLEYSAAWDLLDVQLRENGGVAGRDEADAAIRQLLEAVTTLASSRDDLRRQLDEAIAAKESAWRLAQRLEAKLEQRSGV